MVVVDVLLNLRLPLAVSRLIDRHLDVLIVVRDHDGAKRGVISMDHLVIDRPETMELKGLLVVAHYRLHLQVRLVAHNVVDFVELNRRQSLIEDLFVVMGLVAW